ncbi:MAG: ABC transporter ATP-binding protein [Bacteroidales bacterium]|jgi:ABC-type multidrug transport system ATPase subunit
MIEAENIKKVYQEVVALDGISCTVEQGEIFGFIGPDGAGKTTLFRIISSLMLPDGGKVTIKGLDVVKEFRKIRLLVGYMPGRFSLYSDLTVLENLQFFATVFGTTIKRNYDLIRDVYHQIEPFKNRLAGNLSGGMKQKLALSCALIHEPELLVLDEPTTGVDAISRREFWELLKGLKKKGMTVIVSTPYMDEANMCDKVALMQKGSIMTVDSPSGITGTYGKKLYTLRSSDIYKLLLDMREYDQCESVFPFGQSLHYTDRNQETNRTKLQQYLKLKGHAKVTVEPVEPTIEDVFMRLMKHKEMSPGQVNSDEISLNR